jgi:peptidoglycan hydrolase CwlO-like protein
VVSRIENVSKIIGENEASVSNLKDDQKEIASVETIKNSGNRRVLRERSEREWRTTRKNVISWTI